MSKQYKIKDQAAATVTEPAVSYQDASIEASLSEERWNPNVPFHGAQEEWWEHFHQIEQGTFYTIEEADEEFEIWKKKLLASRM